MLQLKTPWFWGGFSSSALATFLIPELFALSQDECRVTTVTMGLFSGWPWRSLWHGCVLVNHG
jgi:hypothetical protein